PEAEAAIGLRVESLTYGVPVAPVANLQLDQLATCGNPGALVPDPAAEGHRLALLDVAPRGPEAGLALHDQVTDLRVVVQVSRRATVARRDSPRRSSGDAFAEEPETVGLHASDPLADQR